MDDIVQLMKEAQEHSARGTTVSVNLFFWQRIVREIEELRHKVDALALEHYNQRLHRPPARLWPTGTSDGD